MHDVVTSVGQRRATATAVLIAAISTAPSTYAKLAGLSLPDSTHIIDLYSNPFAWGRAEGGALIQEKLSHEQLAQPHCFIIDDLSALIDTLGPLKTGALLAQLRRKPHISAVVCYLHADLHKSEDVATVKTGLTCLVSIQQQPESAALADPKWVPCCRVQTILRRSKGGRASSESKLCRITSKGIEFREVQPSMQQQQPVAANTNGSSEATNAQTTAAVTGLVSQVAGGMKLELTEEERVARGSVRLPYEHQREEGRYATGDFRDYLPPEAGGKGGKLGHILYVRDSDSEDVDSDEDPDDDLDI